METIMTIPAEALQTIATETSRIALEYRKHLVPEVKPDMSIVTNGDKAVARAAHKALAELVPGIISIDEEDPQCRAGFDQAEWAAIIDPIDGTHNYCSGLERFGTAIGIVHRGIMKYGLLSLPEFGTAILAGADGLFSADLHSGTRTALTIPRHKAPHGKSVVSCAQKICRERMLSDPKEGDEDNGNLWTGWLAADGSVVYSNYRLIEGRTAGYVGLINLWDIGGAIPFFEPMGLEMTWLGNGERCGTTVNELIRGDGTKDHWKLKDNVFIAPTNGLQLLNGRIVVPT